jgi:Uncharacterized membrane-associated protein
MDSFTLIWFKHCIAIFFLTFIHEDAAILAAAFSRVEHQLPLLMAYLSVYLGIVAGDLLIYGLGHIAQRNAWLKSKIIGPKIEKLREWLESNMVHVLVICRITPGLLFPTFVACGWFKLSFRRFAVVSILSGAIYSSIVLTVVIFFGQLVLEHLGIWSWAIVLAVVVTLAMRNTFKAKWSKTPKQVLGDVPPSLLGALSRGKYIPMLISRHMGMPSLEGIKKLVSFAEQLPNGLFYIPIGFRWMLLAIRYRSLTLPTISNPMIETGGYWGESKSDTMQQVGEEQQPWLAKFVTIKRTCAPPKSDVDAVLRLMEANDINFPVVVKPDVGWQGYGVRLVADVDHLVNYVSAYPVGEKMLVQRLVVFDGEAGVFYVREPGTAKGRITAIALRYFPYVVGDGKSTIRDLINSNPRSKLRSQYYTGQRSEHLGFDDRYLNQIPTEGELVRLSFIGSIRVGGLYRDASHLITEELTARFDEIARSMPEFYFGRFDIRFESTDLLKTGSGFSVIEINGAGAEAIHAWDPEVPLINLYRELFRTQSMLFKVGALNRSRGYKPIGVKRFLKAAIRQNKLIKSYPAAC